ncbi:AfsR/SARP family transcriptional regulator [Deinococcus yavapaiensis]|uniref:DNA-binding SARP family transcriptional activator n=1 Tax=Deinococcus yavapaiensis KR-236 TaxID=694435 RepID=A0A318S4V3_9DEIO|nr:BTAD domain-containing putative transcriptional regulator [Deinococcus yavapaiensis]PYE52723.1 DNA-binding SARP family transcriptional activator [Deinococcus yavapaiensis KR-236]
MTNDSHFIHPTPTPCYAIRLLGSPRAEVAPGRTWLVERKTAALLAYLVLEGDTPRARLASLLWPATREESARNNLVQLLRKLHAAIGATIVTGRDCVTLAENVTVDVAGIVRGRWRDDTDLGDHRLLHGCDFDDCPELEEWVFAQRARIEEWFLLALRDRAERLERAGNEGAALVCLQRLLDLDPLSEDAHRRLMRLHALTGNRHRALRSFERLREALRRELGVAPLPETALLAQAIRSNVPLAEPSDRSRFSA